MGTLSKNTWPKKHWFTLWLGKLSYHKCFNTTNNVSNETFILSAFQFEKYCGTKLGGHSERAQNLKETTKMKIHSSIYIFLEVMASYENFDTTFGMNE